MLLENFAGFYVSTIHGHLSHYHTHHVAVSLRDAVRGPRLERAVAFFLAELRRLVTTKADVSIMENIPDGSADAC